MAKEQGAGTQDEGVSLEKSHGSHGGSEVLSTIAENTRNGGRCSIKFNLPPSSPPSSPSLSTLTEISAIAKGYIKDTTTVYPSANLEFLRGVHKRTKRKRRLRRCLRVLHWIFVYCLPIGGIILGIVGILLGHFLHIEPIFVGGCLLLITAFGLVLQSCFWKRSLPNKFRAKEVAFNMPQDDSLISKSNEQSEVEGQDAAARNSGSNSTDQPVKSPGLNSAQVRRLSLALNRATAELSAARQINSVGGGGSSVLNLARRLTMGPMQFGDYGDSREPESGNGWIGGRFPHGVRRGLAWNDTGASRFYASNYD